MWRASPWAMALVVVILSAHHLDTEGAPLTGEVFALEGGGAAGQEHAAGHELFLQLGAGDSSTAAGGSAAGSAAGSAVAVVFNPPPLKMPYEANMASNKNRWSKMGGWVSSKEKELQQAQQKLALADHYVKMKEQEKTKSEMGCPCEGEPYYEMVWSGGEDLEKMAMVTAAGSGSAMGSAAEIGGFDQAAVKDADSGDGNDVDDKNKQMDPALLKKMIKKYGRLGPESTWQRKHDIQKDRAARALKKAEKVEQIAFLSAMPQFERMQRDDPAFFTNGKCECPEGWNAKLAEALAKKVTKDKDDAYWGGLAAHRKNIDDLTGKTARLAAQEQAAQDAHEDAQDPVTQGPTQ